jgi:acetamidase/formamidase
MLHVRDASDEQINAGSAVDAVVSLDFTHINPVSGPVEVRGAQPGDTLAVEILEFKPRDWGWTALIPGFGLLADEFPDPWLRISKVDEASGRVQFGEGITLPYRPFPGTIGVAPREPGEHSIVPPSDWGGNLDIKHLRAGTTLYLPVGVEGAMFSVGDTHAAMGDAEVCGTAVETAMDVTVRLSVHKDMSIPAPQYHVAAGALAETETSSYHVCTGVAPDLMEASKRATRAMIDHIANRYDLDRQEAYAICSVACDLRIHELVDVPNWVVGAFLPENIFEGRE